MVYFTRGEEIVVGRLTGRIISNRHEMKATDGTYQYPKSYKPYTVHRRK